MMTDLPFAETSDIDLDILFHSLHNVDLTPSSDERYEKRISDILNSTFDEMLLQFDPNDFHYVRESQYLTHNQFIQNVKSTSKCDLNFLNLNIRSLNKKFEQLTSLLDNIDLCNFIIGLTETWLQDQPHSLFSLSQHNLIFNNRTNKRGGGVAMYVPDHLNFKVLSDINTMNLAMEVVFIEIVLQNKKNIVVGTIYRPPSSNHNEFLVEMQHLLVHSLLQNKHCIIMGDFNVDLLKCNDNQFSHDFLVTLLSYSFVPVISKPTRLSTHSCTLIDNIFVNFDHLQTESGIILSDISDHCPVIAKFKVYLILLNHLPVKNSKEIYSLQNW